MSSTKVEYQDRMEWHNKAGKRHRTDGPAIEWSDGYKHWFLNGEIHREDRPAVEYPYGYTEWFLNGKKYSKDQWENEIIKIKLKRISEL